MAAATVMDIKSRLPGCARQAAAAVSAYTQVQMEDAYKLLKIPKSVCPDMWIRLPKHKWPKSWSSMEDPVVPLERNLYGHPGKTSMGKAIRETSLRTRLGKSSKLRMFSCYAEERAILVCVCGRDETGWEETKH